MGKGGEREGALQTRMVTWQVLRPQRRESSSRTFFVVILGEANYEVAKFGKARSCWTAQ